MAESIRSYSLSFPTPPAIDGQFVTACLQERFAQVFDDRYRIVMAPGRNNAGGPWKSSIGIRRGLLLGVDVVVKKTSTGCAVSIFQRSFLETVIYDGVYVVLMLGACLTGMLFFLNNNPPPGRAGLPLIFAIIVVLLGIGFILGSVLNLLIMPLYDFLFLNRARTQKNEALVQTIYGEVRILFAAMQSFCHQKEPETPGTNK